MRSPSNPGRLPVAAFGQLSSHMCPPSLRPQSRRARLHSSNLWWRMLPPVRPQRQPPRDRQKQAGVAVGGRAAAAGCDGRRADGPAGERAGGRWEAAMAMAMTAPRCAAAAQRRRSSSSSSSGGGSGSSSGGSSSSGSSSSGSGDVRQRRQRFLVASGGAWSAIRSAKNVQNRAKCDKTPKKFSASGGGLRRRLRRAAPRKSPFTDLLSTPDCASSLIATSPSERRAAPYRPACTR